MPREIRSCLPGNARIWIHQWVVLPLAVMCSASGFLSIHIASGSFQPEALALFRLLVASFVLGVLIRPRRALWMPHRDLIVLLACAVIGIGFVYLAVNMAQQTLNAGETSFILATRPGIAVVLGILLLSESLTPRVVIGILSGICGVGLMSYTNVLNLEYSAALLVAALAAFASSVGIVLQKMLLKRYSAAELATVLVWIATTSLLWALPTMCRQIFDAPPAATGAGLFLGVVPSAFGLLLWTSALRRLPATQVVAYQYLIPFVTAFAQLLLFDQVMTHAQVAGGVILCLGLAMTQTGFRRRLGD